MWALIAALVKTIIKIKSIADKLTVLSKSGVEGLIRSIIISETFGAMGKVGIPLDQVYNLQELPHDFAEYLLSEIELLAATEHLSKTLTSILGPHLSQTDLPKAFQTSTKWLVEGKTVANGPSSVKNQFMGADPIVFFTGEFEREVTDLSVNGAGTDFEFRRTYRSSVAYLGPLGPSWDHSYNLRLREENNYVIVRLTGQLSEQCFVKHPQFDEAADFSYYVPPDGVHDIIVPEGNSFQLKRPQGITFCYEATTQSGEHRIREIRDRFGNYLKFKYNSFDQLWQVFINSNYRKVTFEYDELGRITYIRDHFGRYVKYTYDEWNFLECVAGPAYRDEKPALVERYEYEGIGTVRKIARVVDWKNRIVVENEYERNEFSEHFGKVIRQRVNKGEYSFFYETLTEATDHSIPARDRPTLRVWEYRRNGHQVEHILNALGNELTTRERLLESCRIREVVNHYRYNADGEVIAKIDPNGVLTQYLYGRDHLAESMFWPDIDPVVGDIPLKDRQNFGNLLAVVTRGKKVAESGAAIDPAFWDLMPQAKLRDSGDDVIVKYHFDRNSNLLISQSDPRYTESADPLHAESSEYHRHLIRYEHGPGPIYELRKTIFPNRSRPSSLDGVSYVDNISEEIKCDPNNKWRPVERKDSRSYQWFNEYYPSSSDIDLRSKEGFLRRQLIPHIDWVLNKDTPNILEIKRNGDWLASDHYLLSSGIVNDHIRISVEGVRIALYQSSERDNIASDNPRVAVSIDGIALSSWDQTARNEYVINNLSSGVHEVEIRDVSGIPAAIGLIRTHVSIEYAVNALGFACRETDARGNVTENFFNACGQKIKITKGLPDKSSSVVYYEYDAVGRLIFQKEEWRDELGNVRPEIAVVQRNHYDQAGLLLNESVGAEKRGMKRFTHHRYDSEDNRCEMINPRCVRTYFGYDELKRHIRTIRAGCSLDSAVTLKTYDLAGRVLSQRNPLGALRYNGYRTPGGKWQSSVDNRGRVHVQTDPLGHMVVTDYDDLGNPTVIQQFQRRADGQYEMLSRRETDYDQYGDAIRVQNAIFETPILTSEPVNHNRTDDEFNYAHNTDQVQYATTEFHLDANGNTVAIRNPDGGIHRQCIDGQGRVYDEVDAEGRRTFRIYDRASNIIRTYAFDPVNDQSGNFSCCEVFLQLYEYDELNRLTKRIDSYGNEWVQKYDTLGNLTCIVDPLGNVVRFKHNAFGEEVTREQERTNTGLGGGQTLPALITKREYDRNGNVITIIDPAQHITKFKYDGLDRLIESWFAVSPNEPHEYRSYDAADNLTSVTDRNGLIKIMKYDPLNRHIRTDIDTRRVIPENALSPLSPTFACFQYDAAGNRIRHQNDYCTVEIQRDSRGLPNIEKVTIQNIPGAPSQKKIERSFNISGLREKLIYPYGREVRYTQNYMGQVTSIRNVVSPTDYPGRSSNANNFDIAKFTYIGRRLEKMDYGNGLVLTMSFDGRGSVIERTVSKDESIMWRIQSLRDAAGNTRKESAVTRVGARSRKYSLDSIYRLTHYKDESANWIDTSGLAPPNAPVDPLSATQQATINAAIGSLAMPSVPSTYEYDSMGNRLSTREPTRPPFSSTSNHLNQYTLVDGTSWKYDDNGNLRADDKRTFGYDFNNALQVISDITSGTHYVSYYRDALGRVIAEITTSDSIFHIRDGLFKLVEIEGSERREFTPGNRPDSILHAAMGGEDYWVAHDGLSSMKVLTDSSKRIVSVPSYAPFGASEDNELSLSPLHCGFAGMSFTANLNFYHTQHRFYRPDVGRFAQRDPAGLIDGTNPYTYALNNPIDFYDPVGLATNAGAGDSPFGLLEQDVELKLDEEFIADMLEFFAKENARQLVELERPHKTKMIKEPTLREASEDDIRISKYIWRVGEKRYLKEAIAREQAYSDQELARSGFFLPIQIATLSYTGLGILSLSPSLSSKIAHCLKVGLGSAGLEAGHQLILESDFRPSEVGLAFGIGFLGGGMLSGIGYRISSIRALKRMALWKPSRYAFPSKALKEFAFMWASKQITRMMLEATSGSMPTLQLMPPQILHE